MSQIPEYDSARILALRPSVERPDPDLNPIDAIAEKEFDPGRGKAVDVWAVFLRGSECTFKCLMCDLWKTTHLKPTVPGAIPAQVATAVDRSRQRFDDPPPWIKLYNASNFFAPVNVPTQDLPEIAASLSGFERIIVENHPRLLRPSIDSFRDELTGRLEIAMGLETIHPQILSALNKQMNVEDFSRACEWLLAREVDVRAFVLLRPPGLSEQAGIEWCCRSIEFAGRHGVRQVSVIPVRGGNGALDELRREGYFEAPLASSLEAVLDTFVGNSQPVVSVDLWDWQLLRGICDHCSSLRRHRLEAMNIEQQPRPSVRCACERQT